jgi:hypothetical protein
MLSLHRMNYTIMVMLLLLWTSLVYPAKPLINCTMCCSGLVDLNWCILQHNKVSFFIGSTMGNKHLCLNFGITLTVCSRVINKMMFLLVCSWRGIHWHKWNFQMYRKLRDLLGKSMSMSLQTMMLLGSWMA